MVDVARDPDRRARSPFRLAQPGARPCVADSGRRHVAPHGRRPAVATRAPGRACAERNATLPRRVSSNDRRHR